MINKRIISLSELAKFGSVDTLNEQAKSLVKQQKRAWGLLGKNFEAFKYIQTKIFDFEHFRIITQFNPERIRSSAAKTDDKSISERPCFLCMENLPADQKGIRFQNEYLILVNPFPIFKKHLTVSKVSHSLQLIRPHFDTLLELSEALPDFTVFYNGPKCGASAPDHFHFQVGIKGLLPIESEFENLEKEFSELVFQNGNLKVIAVDMYLRRFIALISKDKKEIQLHFKKIYNLLKTDEFEEPMMNVLCNFEEGEWRVILFPREKQRPSHFFKTDEKQIIVSPAAVELGGVIVLPREEDFKKITKKEVSEIYEEVTIENKRFTNLIIDLKKQNH